MHVCKQLFHKEPENEEPCLWDGKKDGNSINEVLHCGPMANSLQPQPIPMAATFADTHWRVMSFECRDGKETAMEVF